MDICIPGYEIEVEIATGAMATVYLATQRSLDRRVALKVMAPILAVDEDFCKRFLREGRTLAKLQHPHIVAIYDIGNVGSRYYMAMEYANGGALKERIGRDGMAPEQALAVMREIAGALGYAHARGLVHRDVKPANILYRADGTAVLSDFGIAKTFDDGTQLTSAGFTVGTPNYMSPEQARGVHLDGRSDLYSLGVMFYEMLTGTLPYLGTDSFSTVLMHLSAPIPRLLPALARFQPLLDRMLAKAPEDRFPDAAALLAFEFNAAWAEHLQNVEDGTVGISISPTITSKFDLVCGDEGTIDENFDQTINGTVVGLPASLVNFVTLGSFYDLTELDSIERTVVRLPVIIQAPHVDVVDKAWKDEINRDFLTSAGMPKFDALPDYDVKNIIAKGGMAVVYRAIHRRLERPVAIKYITDIDSADNKKLKRFVQEGRVLAGISHSNIVSILDMHLTEKVCCIVMEYLSGGSLKKRIKDKKLNIDDVMRVMLSMATALEYLHDKGIVHRDVKSSNILFRSDGVAVLADFGIVKILGSVDITGTDDKAPIGSAAYISPEQMTNKDIDGRSDLYSLGVVFYEMLTGVLPFRGENQFSTMMSRIVQPVPDLPKELSVYNLMLKGLLEKNPNKRFKNARVLKMYIDRLMRAGQQRDGRGWKQIILSWINKVV